MAAGLGHSILTEGKREVFLRILRNTDQRVWSYVWMATLISLFPSLAISAVVMSVLPEEGPSFEGPVVLSVIGMLVLSPWLETIILWGILWILRRFMARPMRVAIASAALWGILHSLMAPAWGLIVAWPFFVFSICFLEWEKISKGRAIVVTALVHTCQNLLPAVALVVSS
jgi:hypothetical protein